MLPADPSEKNRMELVAFALSAVALTASAAADAQEAHPPDKFTSRSEVVRTPK
jgi:hypothetical protein